MGMSVGPKRWEAQYIASDRDSKMGGNWSPVPMIVAPTRIAFYAISTSKGVVSNQN